LREIKRAPFRRHEAPRTSQPRCRASRVCKASSRGCWRSGRSSSAPSSACWWAGSRPVSGSCSRPSTGTRRT